MTNSLQTRAIKEAMQDMQLLQNYIKFENDRICIEFNKVPFSNLPMLITDAHILASVWPTKNTVKPKITAKITDGDYIDIYNQQGNLLLYLVIAKNTLYYTARRIFYSEPFILHFVLNKMLTEYIKDIL